MRNINVLHQILKIKHNENKGVFYLNHKNSLFKIGEQNVICEDVFDFQIIENGIVFSKEETGDFFIKTFKDKTTQIRGDFNIYIFEKIGDDYVVSINDPILDFSNPDSVEKSMNKGALFNSDFKFIKNFELFIKQTNNLIIRLKKNELVVCDFNLNEKWRRDIQEYDISKEKVQFTGDFLLNQKNNLLIVESRENDLYAIDLLNGDLVWKSYNFGRCKLYKNTIYAITNDTLQEIDAETGEILKEQSIEQLVSSHKFFATGEHKVYEEYIFVMNTGAPAMVAIFDRESLQFVEMLKFDHLIPRGTDHLHWHNKKLYVLDWSKTLHVFEE